MARNVIDEYLVALGFDADSSQGKEFLNTYKQIQDQMNRSDSAAQRNEQNAQRRYGSEKSRNQSMKGQYAWIGDAEKAFFSLHKTMDSFSSGNPLGAVFNAYRTYQMSRTLLSNSNFNKAFKRTAAATGTSSDSSVIKHDEDEIAKDVSPSRVVTTTSPDTMDGIVRQIMKDTGRIAYNTSSGIRGETQAPNQEQDWIDHVISQMRNGNIRTDVDSGKVNWNDVQRYIREFEGHGRESASLFKSQNAESGGEFPTASDGGGGGLIPSIGGSITSGGGDAGGAMIASGDSGVGIAGGLGAAASSALAIAGAAAALTAGAVAAYKMADSLAQANVDVESIARNFWMTTNDAWNMTNVLQAMGKTTNDLSAIAANPTLRQQFETLQKYQEQYTSLPKDFEKVNDEWTQGVDTQGAELKMNLEYMKEMAAYDLEKILVGPLSEALKVINKMAEGASTVLKLFSYIYGGSKSGSSDSSTDSNAWVKDKSAQAYLKNYESTMPSSNYYVPNSSSVKNQSTTSVTHNPSTTVNVYPQSGDAKSIGNAAASAVSSVHAQNQSMLIKTLEGVVNR